MPILRQSFYGTVALVYLFLIGCSGHNAVVPQGPISGGLSESSSDRNPLVLLRSKRATGGIKSLYSFKASPDGAMPTAGVIEVGTELFGTTYGGGRYGSPAPFGTAFEVSTSGVENIIHSFGNGSDGATPEAPLLDINGTLYGTTYFGGGGAGTVFALSTVGKELWKYNFASASNNGTNPVAGLIEVNGELYGTTSAGGKSSSSAAPFGTVFKINLSGGGETVLHTFLYPSNDGFNPYGHLLYFNGALYGTTFSGGGGVGCQGAGCGTVFKMTTSGAETVLHRFGSGSDGQLPHSGLTVLNGELYGTTTYGGKYGYGTVFKVSTSGVESVLHSFGSGADGKYPYAGLINLNGTGTLYGTTGNGGASNAGTVFSITQAGSETVLYNLGGSLGGCPEGDLLYANGLLYGTAFCGANGYGTVFQASL